uniref:Uncharacterized protein n=1 Tax=Romanomermis culicivorax TaxID=13658 RepID=A0A915K719_ROMCU
MQLKDVPHIYDIEQDYVETYVPGSLNMSTNNLSIATLTRSTSVLKMGKRHFETLKQLDRILILHMKVMMRIIKMMILDNRQFNLASKSCDRQAKYRGWQRLICSAPNAEMSGNDGNAKTYGVASTCERVASVLLRLFEIKSLVGIPGRVWHSLLQLLMIDRELFAIGLAKESKHFFSICDLNAVCLPQFTYLAFVMAYATAASKR